MQIKTRIKLVKVVFIAGFSGMIGLFFGIQESLYFILSQETLFHKPLASIFLQTMSGLIAGSIFGYIDIFFLREYFRKKSFGLAILSETFLFTIVFFLFTVIVSFVYQIIGSDYSMFDQAVLNNVINYFTGLGVYINFMNWIIAFSLILFILQVSDKFGHGILSKFILGRYHQPKEENRIFMFIDINSSTEIGEKLGHLKYHSLLNDFFSDLTDPIINSGGEIYQYVGDEISASWKMLTPKHNFNCIKCYFDIVNKINLCQQKYRNKYDLIPKFKTGLHGGKVTVGEIGIIKKEIVFTGDVLNTTSRIMNSCKKYETPILVSQDLLDQIELTEEYSARKMEEVQLRGKEKKLALSTIRKIGN